MKNTSTSTAADRASLELEMPDGGRLGYAELGADAGWPVLFFHGWPGSRLQGRIGAEAATRLGVRLIAVDRPGIGRSTRTPGRSLRDWPAQVATFVDRLGIDRFDVLAVSGGGPYALACAASLGERIRRIALICPAPPARGLLENPRLPVGFRVLRALHLHWPGLVPPLFSLLGFAVRRLPWMLLLRPWAYQLGGRDGAVLRDPLFARTIADSTREAFRAGSGGVHDDALILLRPWGMELADVRRPVDLWYGDADRVTPLETCRTLLAGLPRARWHVLPGEGHYSAALLYAGRVLEDLVADRDHE